MNSGPQLGHKIADVVIKRMFDEKRRHHPELVKLGMQLQHDFFTLTGSEHKATTGGLYRDLAATGKLAPWAQSTAEFLGHGSGQWQTMLASTATGAALGGGIMSLLTNEMAPAVQSLIADNPHGLLGLGDLASGVARGMISFEYGVDQAARQGLTRRDFTLLIRLSAQWPAIGQLQDMLNRGTMTHDVVTNYLQLAGFDTDAVEGVLDLRHLLLTPQELAGLVTFGVLTQDAATPIAAKSGISASDFSLLVAGNGEPPSTQDLLFAYRRKIIDKTRLQRGITQGPVRNEWFDVLESLGQVPMSTADAIEAAVQGNLTVAQAQTIAEQNGLMPDQFAPLLATAGSPPGDQFMLKMWQRGLATQQDVVDAMRASRLKNKYVPLMLASAREILTTVEIKSAVTHGVLTADQALPMIRAHGFDAVDAHTILASVSAGKTATIRQLSESQILALYTERAISEVQATDFLDALGWTHSEIHLLLAEGDLRRMRRYVDAAITVVRAAYVARRIDDAQAGMDLDTLGVPPAQKTDLIALWDLERDVEVRTLSLAQLGAALKKSLIDTETFSARVSAMGYDAVDTQILAGLYAKPATTGG